MINNEKQFRKAVAELRVAIAAVDVVLVTILDNTLQAFLIPIHRPPHYQHLAGLPGGVIGLAETADQAARRHLREKAHVSGTHLEQLYTFSDPDRDKRSRSISVAYVAVASPDRVSIGEQTEGNWVPVKKLPPLAYDHREIIRLALDRLRSKLSYTNIVANLLPKLFTLSELQTTYEILLNRTLDKRNFRKKMLSTCLLKEVGKQKKTGHRPAELYTFVQRDLVTIPEMKSVLAD